MRTSHDFTQLDHAVDRLFADSYPEHLVTTLNELGDSPLGFRMAGTPAEHQAADFLIDELHSMGFPDARKEPVPVDAWTLRGASVSVGERTLTASQFPGVPGTGGPLTADLAYVGRGRAADFTDDVTGKLVLIDIEFEEFWFSFPAHEAQLRGAVGVIFTNGEHTLPHHSNPHGLATDESRWNLDGLPAVFVSTVDGSWLKSTLTAQEALQVTVESDVDVQMHDFADPELGGLGFNVVAEIPGSNPDAKAILVAAHYDAYFRSALDNTGAVAQMLTLAMAMKVTGTQFERPIIFLASCGEEFGYADTQYDYLAGAWYAATRAHSSAAETAADRWTGPQGRVGLFINIEESPQKGAPLSCGATPDLVRWFSEVGEECHELLPHGFDVHEPYSVWHDGATFAFAGVPTVVTVAENADYEGFNHTTDDAADLIDYDYMASLVKFYARALRSASAGIAPHDLTAQGEALSRAVSPTRLVAAGADPVIVDGLSAALDRYTSAATSFASRRGSLTPDRWTEVSNGLAAVQSHWYRNLSGMDANDDYLQFSFEQTLRDLEHLRSALSHLETGDANTEPAVKDLEHVGLTRIGLAFSAEVYANLRRRFLPDYYMINWGGQVNPYWHVDVTEQVAQIRAGNVEAAINSLRDIIEHAVLGADVPGAHGGTVHIDGLNERLVDVTATLKQITPMVESLA